MQNSRDLAVYRSHLTNMRNSNIHYRQAAQNISRLTKPFNHMSNLIGRNMRNDLAPMSARTQFGREQAQDFNQMNYTAMNDASIQDIHRKDALDQQIGQVKMQESAAKRQENADKTQAKASAWGTGLGAVTGLALTPLLGPQAIAMGTQLGGGIGQAVGARQAYNRYGANTWNAMQEGVSNSIGALSDGIGAFGDKQIFNAHREEWEKIGEISDPMEQLAAMTRLNFKIRNERLTGRHTGLWVGDRPLWGGN